MGLISDDFNVFHLEDQLGIFWSQGGGAAGIRKKKQERKFPRFVFFQRGKNDDIYAILFE